MAKKIRVSNNNEIVTSKKSSSKRIKKKRKTKLYIGIGIGLCLITTLIVIGIIYVKKEHENKYTPDSCFTVVGNTITSYSKSCSKDVVIPDYINESKIEEIGEQAFYEMDIESVKLPSYLKKIRKEAFFRNKLEEVVIPDSVKKIYSSAFMSNNIKDVKFGKNVELIGSWSFDFNYIEYLEIPDSVTDINYEAFNNNNLKEIIIGKNVNKIEYAAFGQDNWEDAWHGDEQNQKLYKIVNKSGNSFDWYDVLSYDNYANGPEKWLITGDVTTNFGTIKITSK